MTPRHSRPSHRCLPPLAAAALLLPAQAWALPPNMMDWPNSVFGLLFGALTVFTIAISILLRIIVRDTGEAAPTSYLEPITVGYLAAGPDRAFLIALLELMENGHIKFGDDQKIHLTEQSANVHNPFLAQLRDGFSIEDAKRVYHSVLLSLRTTLADNNLILDARRAGLVRLTPILLFVPVIVLGMFKIEVGRARHDSVGLMALLLAMLVVGLVGQYMVLPWRTLSGDKALKGVRRAAASGANPVRTGGLARTVALKGAQALANTDFAELANAVTASRRVTNTEFRNRKMEERHRHILGADSTAEDETNNAPEAQTEVHTDPPMDMPEPDAAVHEPEEAEHETEMSEAKS